MACLSHAVTSHSKGTLPNGSLSADLAPEAAQRRQVIMKGEQQTKGIDIDVPGCWGTAEYTADIVTAAIGEGVHTSPEFTCYLEGGKKGRSSQTMDP